MSDALTDIARDQNLAEESSRVKQMELDFCQNPSIKRAKKLIQKLRGLVWMKSGYWGSTPKSWAYERIALYDNYIKSPNSTGEIRKAVESQQQHKFYFAVHGHERIMGDVEELVIEALKKGITKRYLMHLRHLLKMMDKSLLGTIGFSSKKVNLLFLSDKTHEYFLISSLSSFFTASIFDFVFRFSEIRLFKSKLNKLSQASTSRFFFTIAKSIKSFNSRGAPFPFLVSLT